MRTEEELYVETNYKVLFEDEYFLVVDKPSPLPVHPVSRFQNKNLLSLLTKDLGPGPEGFRIVNRLDSETSGLVLVAKSSFVAGRLGSLFEKREVHKEYRAVVLGVPKAREGSITVPLGTRIDCSHNVRTFDPEGETARTDYEVLCSVGDYSLLKVVTHTGRMHQIRAHLALQGYPIAGDKIYIDPEIFDRYIREGWQEDMRPTVKYERLLLHAFRLGFRHPATGEDRMFEAETPICFDVLLGRRGEAVCKS